VQDKKTARLNAWLFMLCDALTAAEQLHLFARNASTIVRSWLTTLATLSAECSLNSDAA
jgi:hypothetical protein